MALGLDAGNNIIKKNMKQKFHVWLAIVGDIITPLSSHTIKARGGFTLSLAFHLFSIISLYRSTRLGNWHSNRARRAPARRRRKLCISVTFSRLLTIKPDFVEHRSERRWSMLAGINHSNTAAIDLVTITYKLPCCFWPRVKSGDIEHSKKKNETEKDNASMKNSLSNQFVGDHFHETVRVSLLHIKWMPIKRQVNLNSGTSVHTKMLDMYWRFRQFRSDMMKLVKSKIGLENGNNRSALLLVTRRRV